MRAGPPRRNRKLSGAILGAGVWVALFSLYFLVRSHNSPHPHERGAPPPPAAASADSGDGHGDLFDDGDEESPPVDLDMGDEASAARLKAKKAKAEAKAEAEAEAEAEAKAEAARREKRETHEEEKREAADAARFDAEILALQRMARIEAEEAAQSSEFALSAAASDYGDGHGDLFDDGDDFDASPFYNDERAPDGDGGGDLFDDGDEESTPVDLDVGDEASAAQVEPRASNSTAATAPRRPGGRPKPPIYCRGRPVHSEVVYWREPPAAGRAAAQLRGEPEKFLTFELDFGGRAGWNNVRMGVECNLILAHALNRTAVLPPAVDGRDYFRDFLNETLLAAHPGWRVKTMAEFLAFDVAGAPLPAAAPWAAVRAAADATLPAVAGRYVVFPQGAPAPAAGRERATLAALRSARHVHSPGEGDQRLLAHWYAFEYFGDRIANRFYKRFARDLLRYQDEIQCAADAIIRELRRRGRGAYHAIHARRGDFHAPAAKISAAEIVEHLAPLRWPRGSVVYLATDDPDGVCRGCREEGHVGASCEDRPRPRGCLQRCGNQGFRAASIRARVTRFDGASSTRVEGRRQELVWSSFEPNRPPGLSA